MLNLLFAVFNKNNHEVSYYYRRHRKKNDELERCMNLFPQKDYLYKSYSSGGFDKDGKIFF